MAPKSRSQRTARSPKKRPLKKRASKVAGGKARKRASHGRRARHGRGGARRVRARGPHAADRDSRHQRSAGDLRPRRARTALGRYHQGRRRTPCQPRDIVCRCGAKRRSRAWRSAGFFRSARARPQRRRFAGRPGDREGPAVAGRDFRKASGLRDRRSRPAACGAGKPDRQCREVHRSRRRRARGQADARAEGQGQCRLCGFRQRNRSDARTRSSGCFVRSRRPMSLSPRASAAPGSGLPR